MVAARRDRSRGYQRFRPYSRQPNSLSKDKSEMLKSQPNYGSQEPGSKDTGRSIFTHVPLSGTLAKVVEGRYSNPEAVAPAVFCQVLDRNHHGEVDHQPTGCPRGSTPVSDEVSGISDPRPIKNRSFGAKSMSARAQVVMEVSTADCPPDLRWCERTRPSKDDAMQTCEPEGRDTMSALQAQTKEHLATEERRLEELIQVEDRVRELEQTNKGVGLPGKVDPLSVQSLSPISKTSEKYEPVFPQSIKSPRSKKISRSISVGSESVNEVLLGPKARILSLGVNPDDPSDVAEPLLCAGQDDVRKLPVQQWETPHPAEWRQSESDASE
ncbi:MAG: hypothetical protein Q9169_003600 [Polycauliona sp. 2 TL-2023]